MADDDSELLAIMGPFCGQSTGKRKKKRQITELREEFGSGFNNFAIALENIVLNKAY